ncbi:band-7-like membrane protein [Microbacterium phage PauloDiaboli]|nr:band-7-like membrane protein [Microbacterium phage PauloDiaboli]QWY83997.1 band-7-like membrane protein [Microbacterium phage A3Wally]
MLVLAIIVGVLGLLALVIGAAAKRNANSETYRGDEDVAHAVGKTGLIAGPLLLIVGAIFLFFGTFYQNGVGEAKVIVNSVDKTIVGTIETPGAGFKSPLNDFVDFDLFSQQLTFAGGGEGTPSYTGGSVNGKEITVNVGGVDGGSTRANVDLVATYSLSSKEIDKIYAEFRSQELFTEQVIQKQLLSVARAVPAEYTAVEFRGTQRGEAEEAIRDQLNDRLKKYGVEFTTITIQDVRYPESVETALTQIEEANQAAQKAEAEKRTSEVNAEKKLVEAQGQANADIEKARGEAEANRLLSESLTPELIELRKAELLVEASKNGGYIIDNGDGDLLLDNRSK